MSFKNIVILAISVLLVFMGAKWYYGGQADEAQRRYLEERQRNNELVVEHDTEIGQYVTTVSVLEDNIRDAEAALGIKDGVIERLQEQLDAKIQEVNALTIQIAALQEAGQADIIVVDGDSLTYRVAEKTNGVGLDLKLEHPGGSYNYTITHDPIRMELYMAKDNQSQLRVGSIRFPDAPYINVTQWDIVYDPELRPWWKRIWDDVNMHAGVFAGNDLGLITTVGYKNVNVGPMFTEGGMSLGFLYKVK